MKRSEEFASPNSKKKKIYHESGQDSSEYEWDATECSEWENDTDDSIFKWNDNSTVDDDDLNEKITIMTRTEDQRKDILLFLTEDEKNNCINNKKEWSDYVELLRCTEPIEIYGHPFFTRRDIAVVHWRNCGTNNHPFLIARDSNRDGKLFSYFDDPNSYIVWRNMISEEDRNDYEVFFTGEPTRFYVDLDFSKKDYSDLFSNPKLEQILNVFVRNLIDEGCKLLGLEGVMECFQTFTSHAPQEKFSYHIVSTNTYTNSITKVKQWVLDVKKELLQKESSKDFVRAIDEHPYGRSQNFRLLGCCKKGTGRIKKATKSTEFVDSLVVVRERTGKTFIDYADHQPRGNQTQTENKRSPTFPSDETGVYESDIERQPLNKDALEIVEKLGLKLNCVKKGQWYFKNSCGYQCPIHKRIHDRMNPRVYMRQRNYYFDCGRIQEFEKEEGMMPLMLMPIEREIAPMSLDLNKDKNAVDSFVEIDFDNDDTEVENQNILAMTNGRQQFNRNRKVTFTFDDHCRRYREKNIDQEPNFIQDLEGCFTYASGYYITKRKNIQGTVYIEYMKKSIFESNHQYLHYFRNDKKGKVKTYFCGKNGVFDRYCQKLTYDSIEFLPTLDTSKHIWNSYAGFNAELIPEIYNQKFEDVDWSELDLFFEFKMKIICNGNQEVCDHLTCWEATTCQNPLKTLVHLYFIGTGGSGKSTYMEFMVNLAGSSGIALDYNDVVDKFNTLLKDKIVVGINEVEKISSGDLALLKNLFSGKTQTSQKKGIDKEMICNFSHYILCGNKNGALNLCDINDGMIRRLWIIGTNTEYDYQHKKDNPEIVAYWKELYNYLMESDRVYRKRILDLYYTYLMMCPIPIDWVHDNYPTTEKQNEVIRESEHPIIEYLRNFEDYHDNEIIKTDDILLCANNYLLNLHQKPLTMQTLTKRILKQLFDVFEKTNDKVSHQRRLPRKK
jgi:hypothetical protein